MVLRHQRDGESKTKGANEHFEEKRFHKLWIFSLFIKNWTDKQSLSRLLLG
jgi:hypothetical protein